MKLRLMLNRHLRMALIAALWLLASHAAVTGSRGATTGSSAPGPTGRGFD